MIIVIWFFFGSVDYKVDFLEKLLVSRRFVTKLAKVPVRVQSNSVLGSTSTTCR